MSELEQLLLVYGLGTIGTIGFIEWFKELLKAIATKNKVGLLASILSLIFSCVIGIAVKLTFFANAHMALLAPLILGALSPIQLGYQIVIQGVPAVLDTMFKSLSSFMSAAVKETAGTVANKTVKTKKK